MNEDVQRSQTSGDNRLFRDDNTGGCDIVSLVVRSSVVSVAMYSSRW